MFDAVVAVAKALVALGRERDYATYGEVQATLSAAQVSPEMVEDLVAMLDDIGISVVPDPEDDGPDAWRDAADQPRKPDARRKRRRGRSGDRGDKYRRTKQRESDMTIDDIYQDLRGRGLVASLRSFSRDFLGRAENYAADRGLDRCAPAALVHLHRRLGAERQADLQARVLERLLQHGAARPAPCPAPAASSASLAGGRA